MSRREPLIVPQDPSKFGGNTHCGSRDIMFLVVEEEDSSVFVTQKKTRMTIAKLFVLHAKAIN